MYLSASVLPDRLTAECLSIKKNQKRFKYFQEKNKIVAAKKMLCAYKGEYCCID